MSKAELDEYFNRYVFGSMFTDIRREIALGRAHQAGTSPDGGGNFLAALGLLCYTEALGKLALANPPRSGSSPFEAFFDTLADGRYGVWRREWEAKSGKRVRDVFRNGMAHEYLPKKDALVYMLGDALPGIGQDGPPDGPVFFFVEAYFRDFEEACRKLHESLSELRNPQVPRA